MFFISLSTSFVMHSGIHDPNFTSAQGQFILNLQKILLICITPIRYIIGIYHNNIQ